MAILAASLMEEDLSVLCAKYGLQSCQFCDALGCADNTSKEAEEWRREHEKSGADSSGHAADGAGKRA